MPFEISVAGSPPVMVVTVTGTIDAALCQAVLSGMTAQGRRHGDPHVIVDTREGTAATTATDLYQLMSDLMEAGFGRKCRMALVYPERPDFDRGAFMEELARNRKLAIKGFHDPDAARAWLFE